MSSSFFWMIVGMGIATYLTRFPALLIGAKGNLPRRLVRALLFAPLGVFTALAVPPLFLPESTQSWEPTYLIGGIASAGVAWKTRQPLWAMAAGVLMVALLRLFLAS